MHQEVILTFISYYLRSKFYKAIALLVKQTNKQTNLPANTGDVRDVGLIPGLERSPGEGRKWQSTPVFLPGNPMDRGDWQTTIHG